MTRLPLLVLLALFVAGSAQATHGGVHPTELDLTLGDMRTGADATLQATVRDGSGDPLVGAEVVFELEATFGWLELGRRFTNAAGEAFLEYVPTGEGAFTFRARFEGTGDLAPSQDVATATVLGPPPEGSPFPTATAAAFVVALVVGSIWGAYAFVLLQVRGIWIDGGGVPRLGRPKVARSK